MTLSNTAAGFVTWALEHYFARKDKNGRRMNPNIGLIQEETDAINRLLRTHDMEELKSCFLNMLNHGILDRQYRAFSIFTVKMQGQNLSPNCVARCHIKNEYFGIYDFAVALSVKKGQCWLSTRVVAKWCCCSRTTAWRAVRWLVRHGWLLELKKPEVGAQGRGRYEPVSHKDWISDRGDGYSLKENARCVLIEGNDDF